MSKANEHMERIQQQAEALDKVSKDCIDISNELIAILMDNESQERQIAALNEANERLRVRLKLAESRCGDGFMKLPVDADGVPIRIGDEVFFKADNGNIWCRIVSGYRAARNGEVSYFTAENEQGGTLAYNAKLWTHRKLEPPDSWEQLEEDMMRGATCAYFRSDKATANCFDCLHGAEQSGTPCWKNERLDILKRAKKLAGIEEEAER